MADRTTEPIPPEFAEIARAWMKPEVRWGRAFATAGVLAGLGALAGLVVGYWAGRADGLARR
jgi:hypothetical protein